MNATLRSSRHALHPFDILRLMAVPPDRRGSWKEFLLFLVKALGMLAGIFAFGFVIFWMRRATVGGH